MRGMEAAEPQDIVLVGATGDLARRKLLPAIYNLALDGLLPREGSIIGYARSKLTDEEFRRRAEQAVREHSRRRFDEAVWRPLAQRLRYVCARDSGLAGVAGRGEQQRRLIYLATPPSVFGQTARELAEHGLDRGGRLLVVSSMTSPPKLHNAPKVQIKEAPPSFCPMPTPNISVWPSPLVSRVKNSATSSH